MAQDHAARASQSPWHMPFADWKSVLASAWREQGDDNIGIVAAGVAFYGFLALVPMLGALVLTYGLVASPETVVRNVRHLTTVMPGSSAKLVGEQLMHVVQTSGTKKGAGLLIALGVALFGARSGAGSLITALNIAYEEKETRGFVRINLLALGITAAAILFAIMATIAIAALGHLDDLLPFASGSLLLIGKLLSYVLLAAAGAAVAATLYRYAPARQGARWQWLTPGSLATTVGWLLLTLGFGLYVKDFGNYNATYGSLGAVIVLLTWLYLSSYVFLFGAELNSEIEKLLAGHRADPGAPSVSDAVQGGTEPQARAVECSAPSSSAAALAALANRPGGTPTAPQPSLAADLITATATSRFAGVVGSRRTGLATTVLAVLGLGLLRRRGHELVGSSLLTAAAGLAWLKGRGEPQARTGHP